MRHLFLLPLLTTLGCFAGSPQSPPINHQDMSPAPQQDAGPPPPPMFTVSATPQRTYWKTVPVSGTGPANGMVIIQSTQGGAQTATIGPDRSFCADVPLMANADNTITLRPQDSTGMLGAPVTVIVTQSGTPPPPQMGVPSYNVAKFNPVDNSGWVHDGQISYVNDDNVSTEATIFSYWGSTTSVAVHLGSGQKITKVETLFDTSCQPDSFDVYTSNADTPGTCDPSNANWVLAGHANTVSYDNTTTFGSTTAQHVCIISTGRGCRLAWGFAAHSYIEVQAWTEAYAAPPPPHAPTCGGMGSL